MDLHDQWVQIQDSQLEASTMLEPILEWSMPPFACIESLLGGRGVDSRVVSWRACLTRSFLGGDVFLLSLLIHYGVVPTVRQWDLRKVP
jgi:hypothetical protein